MITLPSWLSFTLFLAIATAYEVRPDPAINVNNTNTTANNDLIDFEDDESYESAEEDGRYNQIEQPPSEQSSVEDGNAPWSDGGAEGDSSDDEPVDPLVAEDMEKFTDTFKGIGARFRLINRIGEGKYASIYVSTPC